MHRIIIDTENYAGSFERPMIAYATGCADSDTGYTVEAAAARAELVHHAWWQQNIVPQKDHKHKGYFSIVEIWPSPNWGSDGSGGHFHVDSEKGQNLFSAAYLSLAVVVKTLPPSEVWEEFQERVIDFCDNQYMGTDGKRITLQGVRQEPLRPKMKVR